ncbi:MAG: ABC transporter ATP-binding protein [Sporolactobacillus sp.]
MERLRAEQVTITYGNKNVVEGLNLIIPQGKVTALIGANGSGKSTILRTLSRLMRPSAGLVLLDGRSIHKQSTREIARHLTILPQNPQNPAGLSVQELVSYGRYPRQRGMHGLSDEDKQAIASAIDLTGLRGFAERPVDSLSGGQRQRAWIAMALAQETEWLFLDEPTTYLDMTYQLDILNLIRRLNREEGRTIVMIIHDLNQAARYADHLVAIKSGQVVCQGPPEQVINEQMLENVFAVKADIFLDKRSGVPLCMPYETVHVSTSNKEGDSVGSL